MVTMSNHVKILLECFRQRRFSDMESLSRVILAKTPDDSFVWKALAVALEFQGRVAEAVPPMSKVAELSPKDPEAYSNLGNLLWKLDRLDEAERYCRLALELKPDYPEAISNLGNILRGAGRLNEAEQCFCRALKLKPDYSEAFNNLGTVLNDLGRFAEAEQSFLRALKLAPDYPEAHCNLGNALNALGRFREAELSYLRALEIKPEYPEARWATAILPLSFAGSPGVLRQTGGSVAEELDQLGNWFDSGRIADGFKAVGTLQPFYLPYQEVNNKELLSRYGALCHRLMSHWQQAHGYLCSTAQRGQGKIRIGIISGHIRSHSVWNALTKGLLQCLDRRRFEVYVFYTHAVQDQATEHARYLADQFVTGMGSLSRWVDSVISRNIQVLLYPELGMEPMTLKLASLRLAPVQMVMWGHPETTGLPTIDYYVSAEAFEPENGVDNYSEKLVALPHLGCCYSPASVTPVKADRTQLGIARDMPLLICPGISFKYAPQFDWVFVEIARRLQQCQLVFFTLPHRPTLSDRLMERLQQLFEKSGLTFQDYCVFIPWLDEAAFYGLMQEADIFLDTIGFSGFNTAMQAVACSLPIVTREGHFMRGRLASGILKTMGMNELVATTEEEYISLAVRLVRDRGYRQLIRNRLENLRCQLYEDQAPVRALETFLADLCAGEGELPR